MMSAGVRINYRHTLEWKAMSVSGATAGAWSLAAYGIANEDALPADVAATLIELKSKGPMKSLLSEAAAEIK